MALWWLSRVKNREFAARILWRYLGLKIFRKIVKNAETRFAPHLMISRTMVPKSAESETISFNSTHITL